MKGFVFQIQDCNNIHVVCSFLNKDSVCESHSLQTNNFMLQANIVCVWVCGCPHSACALHHTQAIQKSPDWSPMWAAHSAFEGLESVSGLLSLLPRVITRAQEFVGRIVPWLSAEGICTKISSYSALNTSIKNALRDSTLNCTKTPTEHIQICEKKRRSSTALQSGLVSGWSYTYDTHAHGLSARF